MMPSLGTLEQEARQEMPALGQDDVHIHLCRPEGFAADGKNLLNKAERERADAFKFDKDRDLYIAAHVFLRQVLSRYAPVPPENWQFVNNAYGKPAIANAGYERLRFNLAHTGGRVACAVARNRAVGVDVEQHKCLGDLPALCRYAFSPLEAEDVLSARLPGEQEQRFFSYWTLKEAYIKARGMGLSLPLQQFSFVREDHQGWRLEYAQGFQDDGETWQFDTRRLGENHALAYCVQTGGDVLKVQIMEAEASGTLCWSETIE
jgi:4'-phosphopantetheinyl transferase